MTNPHSSATRTRIHAIVAQVCADKGLIVRPETIADDAMLYGTNGTGLDSLDMAVLSTLLEKEFGDDPFSHGVFARSIGEIIQFYETPSP